MIPPHDALLLIAIGITIGAAIGLFLGFLFAQRFADKDRKLVAVAYHNHVDYLSAKANKAIDDRDKCKAELDQSRADHEAAVQGWEKTEAERDAALVARDAASARIERCERKLKELRAAYDNLDEAYSNDC